MTPRPAPAPKIDLDMLAYDIADLMDRGEYGMGDVADSDFRAALPAFLAAAQAHADTHREGGGDAATWTPPALAAAPDPAPDRRPEPVRHGQVRVFPIYIFRVADPEDPERDEVWITDYDKAGPDVARRQAQTLIEMEGGEGATVSDRPIRVDSMRWCPPVGTPRGSRPW